jgi:tripartite ATP-independent transporter DctM subunit
MQFDRVIRSTEAGIDRMVTVLSYVAASILTVMMLLTAADVFLRYLFSRPVLGTVELTEFMMALLVFLALAYAQKDKEHVRVDLVVLRASPLVQSILETINGCIVLGTFCIITWRLLKYAELIRVGQYESPTWLIPFYPFVYVAAFCSFVMCLLILTEVGGHIRHVLAKERTWGGKASLLFLIAVVLALFATPVWISGVLGDVSNYALAAFFICFLVVVIFIGTPVAFAMAFAGFLGTIYITGLGPGLSMMAMISYNGAKSYGHSVIPLFVLMGSLCAYSGLSRDLFSAGYKWLGRLPGGLAIASVAACACFAAVTGSGAATAATIGAVALPEMKRYRYDTALATGAIAAGGTMGILIPPSIPLALYGLLTEQSIGKLFLAGVIPGILEAVFYIITISIMCSVKPALGPRGPRSGIKEKIVSLRGSWAVLVLFIMVIGGLYAGVFTPTEAAGAGAFAALVLSVVYRRLGWKGFTGGLFETVKTSGMILFILIGGLIFGHFLVETKLPFELATMLTGLAINRYVILFCIIVVYLFLGCIMSALAMIVITVPIFFPVIVALGFDPIWFGIIIVRMVEIGAITPPIGMNVFIIQGIAKDVPMYTVFRGIVPFLIADFCHVAMLIAVPEICLVLPNMMK